MKHLLEKLLNRINKYLYRLIIYIIIGVALFGILLFLTEYFSITYVNAANNRYLLSAMAQTQGAIIAIVVTISLVAVQLGASSYSPRVIRILRRSRQRQRGKVDLEEEVSPHGFGSQEAFDSANIDETAHRNRKSNIR